jgi:hypothetical protein
MRSSKRVLVAIYRIGLYGPKERVRKVTRFIADVPSMGATAVHLSRHGIGTAAIASVKKRVSRLHVSVSL